MPNDNNPFEIDMETEDANPFDVVIDDPKKKIVGATTGTGLPTGGEKPVPQTTAKLPSSSESVDALQKQLGKTNPLARINLYKNTLDGVNKRLSDAVTIYTQAKQNNDQATIDKILPQIKLDQVKSQTLQKGIEGQKKLAQIKEPNTYANVLGIGIEHAAGILATGLKAVDESITALQTDALKGIGIDVTGYQKKVEQFKKDQEAKGQPIFEPKSASDFLAKEGLDLIRNSNVRSQEKNVNLPYGGSGWEAIKSGDISKGAEYGSKAFLESLPASATFLNPYTAAATMSGMVGEEIQGAKDEGKDVDATVVLAGTIKAGLELATERMFGAGKATRQLISSLTKEGAEKAVKEATEKMVKESLFKKLGKNYSEEVVGEIANQIGDNAVDIYVNGKHDVKLTDGLGEAGWTALFGAGVQGTGSVTIKHVLDNKSIAKAEELKQKSSAIMDESLHQESETAAKVLEDKAHVLSEESDKIIESQNHIGDNASPETVAKITETNTAIEELDAALQASPSEESAAILTEQKDILEKQHEKLLKQATKEADANIKEEKNPVKVEQQTENSSTDLPDTNTARITEGDIVEGGNIKEEASNEKPITDNVLSESNGGQSKETSTANTGAGIPETTTSEPAKMDTGAKDDAADTKGDNSGTSTGEQPTQEPLVSKGTDAEIEKRMSYLEDAGIKFDSKERKEFNALEKEMEKRERASVFNVPLNEAKSALNALSKKEKEMPNGYGAFIEKRDISESKQVIERYSEENRKELSDKDLMNDFKNALMGNPDTWYADGLKLRESAKEAADRGITFDNLLNTAKAVFTKDGYDDETAESVVLGMLKPIFKNSKTEIITDKPKLKEGEITPEEKSNLETIAAKTGDNFRVVQNIYNKYGDGKPLSEITAEDFRQAEEKRNVEKQEKLNGLNEDLLGAKTDSDKTAIQEKIDKLSGKFTGVKHEETAKLREEFGIPEREISVKKQKQLEDDAQAKLGDGYNVEKLIRKLEKGVLPTDVEQEIMKSYIGGLADKVAKNPTDANIAEARRAIEASDKIGGTEVARSLAARRGIKQRDESLLSYFMEDIEANEGADLTAQQKKNVEKEFADISEARKKYEDKIAELERENNRLQAEKEINVSRSKPRNKGVKKSHEEYVAERKKIVDDIKLKLRKARAETNSAIIPYVKELVIIAPDVAKMIDSYVREGIVKFDEVISGIHDTLQEDVPDITKDDVVALVAGKYNQKPKPRNEITKQIFDLKQEAKLIGKLQELESGEEPTIEKKKVERNKEIASLQKQIKEHDLTKLTNYKKQVLRNIEKLEEELKQTTIEKAPARVVPKLDSEALQLKDRYIKLKQEREIRIIKQQYANRTKFQKLKDQAIRIGNIPRTVMSSMDFSAPLRQALVATVSHPTVAAKAFVEMFKHAVSQKAFDRWFLDVQEDPRYAVAKESGLFIADPHDPKLTAQEEAFMGNLVEKVPVIGSLLIKGSERAYVTYLNKMRWDLFNNFTEELEAQGKTVHNSPAEYKGFADYVNNATGRGKLLASLEEGAPLLSAVFFAPRLIASRLNFLNPAFYAKLPKAVRIQAIKDVSITIGVGLTVLALASLGGAEVEDDPRSTDFGKIKVGNTRWDIWGGYQQYIRLMAQLITGQTKSSTTGRMSTLDGKGAFGRTRANVIGSFFRGKLAPIPAMSWDFIDGRTVTGEQVSIPMELERMLPLIYSDVKDAYDEQGAKALITTGIPATFGIGVSTYTPRNDKYKK